MLLSHRAALAAVAVLATGVLAACQPVVPGTSSAPSAVGVDTPPGSVGASGATTSASAEATASGASSSSPAPSVTTPAVATPITTTSAVAAPTPPTPPAVPYGSFLRPFDADSHWNTPIGDGAVFAAPQAFPTSAGIDTVRVWRAAATDPVVATYDIPGWAQSRCQGTKPQEQAQWHDYVSSVQIPNGTIPDAVVDGTTYWTPNSKLSVVEPDGRTVRPFVGTCRTDDSGPVFGYAMPSHPLDGDGLSGGCHGGSGLPCIGGVIRDHEVSGGAAIDHVVAINIGGDYMYYDRAADRGWRWPANTDDAYAADGYQGADPNLRMGSLLALPPSVDVAALGLGTEFGRSFARAAQEYGLLVSDDSGLDQTDVNMQDGAEAQLTAQCGGTEFWRCAAYQADMQKILGAVQIVVDHTPTSVGGGA